MDGIKASEKLKALRKALGLSRGELYGESNVSASTIQRLETMPNQWNTVTPRTLKNLADALGVGRDYFTNDDDDNGGSAGEQAGSILKRAFAPVRNQQMSRPTAAPLAAPMKQKAAPTIMTPISDGFDMPRPAHLEETWSEKALCFLEGQRRAYLDFLNDPDGTADGLVNASAEAAYQFGTVHNLPTDDDEDYDDDDDGSASSIKGKKAKKGADAEVPKMDPDEQLYKEGAWFSTNRNPVEIWGDFDPGLKVVTKGVESKETKDRSMITLDRVEIDGKERFIICPHGTRSKDPKDHPYPDTGE